MRDSPGDKNELKITRENEFTTGFESFIESTSWISLLREFFEKGEGGK